MREKNHSDGKRRGGEWIENHEKVTLLKDSEALRRDGPRTLSSVALGKKNPLGWRGAVECIFLQPARQDKTHGKHADAPEVREPPERSSRPNGVL